MTELSICIPTYNRDGNLINFLNSIYISSLELDFKFQVCVSDNCSTDNTQEVVSKAQSLMDIKYHKNSKNLGRVRNYLNVVNMAEGEFIWLIGDDDLLMPDAIKEINLLIKSHRDVDFFFINSCSLSDEYLKNYPTPFDTLNLPTNMTPFSKSKEEGELPFLELIDPDISFDFLGGMFLSVFRKSNWTRNINVLDKKVIDDELSFSHFDNTFPHLKIFSSAFSKSLAYFHPIPMSVNLSGAREWAPMSPLINIVRLVEALDEYKKQGLPLKQYLKCKNYVYRTFIPDFLRLIVRKGDSGYHYIKPYKLFVSSLIFPNTYLSSFYYLAEVVSKRFKMLSNEHLRSRR